MLSFQHVNIRILHTWSPLWKHLERAQKIFKALSWESHTLGSSAGAGGPSGPHRPAPHPPPVRPARIWHSTPTLHTCVRVWSRLDDDNDDTVIPVGGLFFQGHSTPTPPMDRSEGDAEWARSAILICCNRRWCVTSLQCRMGQSRARPWKTPFGGG